MELTSTWIPKKGDDVIIAKGYQIHNFTSGVILNILPGSSPYARIKIKAPQNHTRCKITYMYLKDLQPLQQYKIYKKGDKLCKTD